MAGKGGGAWKVAYADFVTAMMALFMVLWISSQDKEILVATSRYFQQPFNSPLNATSGVLNLDAKAPTQPNNSKSKDPEPGDGAKAKADVTEVDMQFLTAIMKDFYRMLHLDENLEEKPIDIQVTGDGLRVTLYDYARKPLFVENTAEFTEWGRFVMQSLAWMIDRHRFKVVIDGHTRTGLVLPKEDYTPWELSADRANAARRALTHYAVDPRLIDRVTGFADSRPVPLEPKDSPANQRISLSLSLDKRMSKRQLGLPVVSKP